MNKAIKKHDVKYQAILGLYKFDLFITTKLLHWSFYHNLLYYMYNVHCALVYDKFW